MSASSSAYKPSLPELVEDRWGYRNLQHYLREEHPEVLDDLTSLCPYCGSRSLRRVESQVVCTKCGVVVEELYNPDQHLPFDTTYAPTANISYGDSLGGTLSTGNLKRVLGDPDPTKLGLEKEDIEFIKQLLEALEGRPVSDEEVVKNVQRYIRSIFLTHIKTQVNRLEPRQSMRLKQELTDLLQEHRLYTGKEYNEFHHKLANKAGKIASKLGKIMDAAGSYPLESYRKLATAILVFLLKSFNEKRLLHRIQDNEEYPSEDIKLLSCLATCPHLKVNSLNNPLSLLQGTS